MQRNKSTLLLELKLEYAAITFKITVHWIHDIILNHVDLWV